MAEVKGQKVKVEGQMAKVMCPKVKMEVQKRRNHRAEFIIKKPEEKYQRQKCMTNRSNIIVVKNMCAVNSLVFIIMTIEYTTDVYVFFLEVVLPAVLILSTRASHHDKTFLQKFTTSSKPCNRGSYVLPNFVQSKFDQAEEG